MISKTGGPESQILFSVTGCDCLSTESFEYLNIGIKLPLTKINRMRVTYWPVENLSL
jgi:hypothetical protein